MNKNEELLPYYQELSKAIYFLNGVPYWNINRGNVGESSLAGSINDGYRFISYSINGLKRKIKASRLHWFIVNGSMPVHCIDHINHKRDDDRIENLREASQSQNQMNKSRHKGSSSKYIGVSWHKEKRKWRACIKIKGKQKYLGSFISEDDAGIAYNNMAIIHHGEFANLNKNF